MPFLVPKDVGRLNISVQNVARMHVLECTQQVVHVSSDLVRESKQAPLDICVGEQLAHNRVASRLWEVVPADHLGHAGMALLQHSQDSQLLGVFPSSIVLITYFDCHRPARCALDSFVHYCVVGCSDPPFEFELLREGKQVGLVPLKKKHQVGLVLYRV